MNFSRIEDYGLIRQIMTADRRSYEAHRDDFAVSIEEFEPIRHPSIWYVLAAREDGRVLGMFICVPLNPVLYEVHNCLLRRSWGPQAWEAGKGAIEWMFEHSPARRIVGATPAYLRLAIAFAKRCGMVEYGRNPGAMQKNGVLHDLVLTGISKDQVSKDE